MPKEKEKPVQAADPVKPEKISHKEKMMRVTSANGHREDYPLPRIPDLSRIQEHMMGISKRGVLFPNAVSFEVVEVEVVEDPVDGRVVSQEDLKAMQG